MTSLVPYLNFDGTAQKAMEFYTQCFNGKLEVMPYTAEVCGGQLPPGTEGRVMHACLAVEGKPLVMASDTMPGMPFQQGNNVYISVHPGSVEETDRLFNALAKDGKVEMPLQDMFWGGYFGTLVDQYGVNWMFNFDKNPKKA